MNPTYQGEVQLLGWKETHNAGATITFQLSDPSELEAFKSMTVRKGKIAGQRLACVLVEIGDDEQPIDPAQDKPKGGRLSQNAAMICDEPAFKLFAESWGYSDAADFVRDYCLIESRAELDSNQRAAKEFAELMRLYREWNVREAA